MIASVVIGTSSNVSFIKIEINKKELTKVNVVYDITNPKLIDEINDKHRVKLPCTITDNEKIVFYVPETWDDLSIENYTQALLDEIYLLTNGIKGHKTKEQIEESFKLEVVML